MKDLSPQASATAALAKLESLLPLLDQVGFEVRLSRVAPGSKLT